MVFLFLLLLLLLLLWLWFLVKYFSSKTSKNIVFCAIFVLVKETHGYLRRFCSVKDENRPKTSLFTLFFSERVKNTMFCDFFSTRGFKCTANTTVFFMFSLPVLKANQPKTVVFTVFWQDKTTCPKKRCFGTIFRIFSARARQVKNQSFFAAFLPPLIRTQEGVKSPKIAKLHLNLTFYLSQSLLQSSNP